MKTPRYQVFTIIFLLFLLSCNEPEQRIARSVGATGEILVVSQNDLQWDRQIGESVRAFFGQDQYGLPQSEPIFKLSEIKIDKLSEMFKKHRNLFVIEINPKLSEAQVETRSDLWAKPQRVVKISAPNAESWAEAFAKNKEGFLLLYNQTERERLLNIFRPTAKADLMEEVYKTFQMKMLIPEGFYVAKQLPGFMWLRKETNDMSQGFILYQRPYRDTADFSLNKFVKVRDSLLFQYVPGPSDGSFMTTDKEFVKPKLVKTTHFVTDYATEVRGMWNVTGDFMAGPYLSYTFVNPASQQLVTAEGYIYYPNKDKRDQLRQLEALLHSIAFN
ncbi:MAG TPA: DUF4837 family protein [Bacteroidales bacterium]|nr:DUF4837 family protein [Bacteroidales bacterium]